MPSCAFGVDFQSILRKYQSIDVLTLFHFEEIPLWWGPAKVPYSAFLYYRKPLYSAILDFLAVFFSL